MTPARLDPPVQNKTNPIIEILNKPLIIKFGLLIALIVLAVLLTALCYAVVGYSATESGNYFNHIKDVV